ncbi:hypothetical protein [Thermocoleostomius sinensis]|uniref:Uncharacterized protein n=1 Tax=Thermocoleostomius sinensis A174 TaxID=2016057 RepID=A0A9E8ZDP6_9CYAN|nr:hypothetical protein [Thermocoleostomius sinensis]WAL60891.1 hypothetical protein OXH18_02520 [Thermocoleostomius sinensis A174]
MVFPRGRLSIRQQQDGIYFLQGLTVALAVQAAIATVIGALLALMIAVAPTGLREILGTISSPNLAGNVMIAALIQTVVWGWLPTIGFVPRRWGRWMMRSMGGMTLLMFVLVLAKIW